MGCACSKSEGSELRPGDDGAYQSPKKPDQAEKSPHNPTAKARRASQSSFSHTGPDGSPCSSSSFGGGEVRSDSEWDKYSIKNALAGSTRACASRQHSHQQLFLGDGVVSPSGGSAVLRQGGSLFGITSRRPILGVKDTQRLRLCKVGGCTFVNQYLVIKYLGRGSCGRVFLCMNIDDRQLYAVKIVKKGELEAGKVARSGRKRDPIEDLQREIAVMRRMLHPNVVALREVVDDSTSNKMLLVMDYMEGGPVMTREGLERGHRIPEPVARLYFRHMAQALDYLHASRVVHGDLKPENALMSGLGRVALSDFGCAKVLTGGGGGGSGEGGGGGDEDEGLLDRCNGTPAFLAPEMMKPNARFRGRPADIYALGACLFTFVFGRIPFSAPTVMKLFEVVQSTPLSFPEGIPVSAPLKELLEGMLTKDPDKRINLDAILKHPWVTLDGRYPILPTKQRWQQQQQQPGGKGGSTGGGGGGSNGSGSIPAAPAAPRESSIGAAAGAAGSLGACSPDGLLGGLPAGASGRSAAGGAGIEEEEEEDELGSEDRIRGMVAGELEVVRYQAGQHLFRQGERGSHMLYILEGECEVRYTPTHCQNILSPQSTPGTTPGVSPRTTPASTPGPSPSPTRSVGSATVPRAGAAVGAAARPPVPAAGGSAAAGARAAPGGLQAAGTAQQQHHRRALSFQSTGEGEAREGAGPAEPAAPQQQQQQLGGRLSPSGSRLQACHSESSFAVGPAAPGQATSQCFNEQDADLVSGDSELGCGGSSIDVSRLSSGWGDLGSAAAAPAVPAESLDGNGGNGEEGAGAGREGEFTFAAPQRSRSRGQLAAEPSEDEECDARTPSFASPPIAGALPFTSPAKRPPSAASVGRRSPSPRPGPGAAGTTAAAVPAAPGRPPSPGAVGAAGAQGRRSPSPRPTAGAAAAAAPARGAGGSRSPSPRPAAGAAAAAAAARSAGGSRSPSPPATAVGRRSPPARASSATSAAAARRPPSPGAAAPAAGAASSTTPRPRSRPAGGPGSAGGAARTPSASPPSSRGASPSPSRIPGPPHAAGSAARTPSASPPSSRSASRSPSPNPSSSPSRIPAPASAARRSTSPAAAARKAAAPAGPTASPAAAATPPAARRKHPSRDGSDGGGGGAVGGSGILSPGPHPRHMTPDIDNAYSAAVGTPEKGGQDPEQDIQEDQGQELPPTLIESTLRAQTLVGELRRGTSEFLVAVRGPGQVVGEMEVLGGSSAKRAASVVAATPVRVAVVPYATAKEYLSANPLAKQQLAELMWLRQSENILLEALVRLAAVGVELEAQLGAQQAQQQQGGGAALAPSPFQAAAHK